MTNTIYTEWLKERYGSNDAIDKAHKDLQVMHNDWKEWSLAVCEDAGIPWDGWRADAARCARQRLIFNESERETVRVLNLHHGDQVPALSQWLYRDFMHTAYSPDWFSSVQADWSEP